MSISIIIPVYNQEKWILETLSSVKKQSFSDFECIIINDGSNDGSLAIIQEFIINDNRFKVYNQMNNGVSAARNRGIEIAEKKYITFLDGDDTLELDALEIMYKTAEENKVNIVIGKMQHNIEGKNKDISTYVQYKVYNSGRKTLEKNPEILHSIGPTSKLFLTKLIKDLKFPTHIKFAEEHSFIIQAYIRSKEIYVINKLVYNYMVRPNNESLSTTNQTHIRTFEFMSDLIAMHHEVFKILNGNYPENIFRYYTFRITEFIMYPLLINAIKEPNFRKYSNLLINYFNHEFFQRGMDKKMFTKIYYLKLINYISLKRYKNLYFYFNDKDVLNNTTLCIRILAKCNPIVKYYIFVFLIRIKIVKSKSVYLINRNIKRIIKKVRLS